MIAQMDHIFWIRELRRCDAICQKQIVLPMHATILLPTAKGEIGDTKTMLRVLRFLSGMV